MIPFLLGAAAGYVLGTRAGRERYEQLTRTYRRVADHPGVQGAAGIAKAKVVDAASAATTARARVVDAAGAASTRLRKSGGAEPATTEPAPSEPATTEPARSTETAPSETAPKE